MRSSFVQRLKKANHENVTTKLSEQKSNTDSIKLKSTSFKNPKKQVAQHCQDIKKLLSILGEVPNPESEINVIKFYQKAKTQQIDQHSQKKKISLSKKENFNQNHRRTSSFCPKSHKNKDNLKKQKFEDELFINLQRRDVQNCNSSLYFQQRKNKVTDKSDQYHFPNKIRKNDLFVQSPIKMNQNKKQIPNPSQKSTKEQIPLRKNQNKKTGLENTGNTCYINSIVQCLFHLSSFSTYFINEQYLHEISQFGQKFNSDRSIIQKYRDLYLYVIKGINNEGEKKSACSLKLALSKSCSLFLDWQQQDAHEFLRKLIDAMHQEINRGQKSSPYKLLKTRTKLQYSSISSLADQYFQYYKQKDDSFIYDTFGGQLYNNIRCIDCKNQSISFQNCLDISLPLIKGKTSLYELMDEFFGAEKLSDLYRCQFCGQLNKNCTKTTKFWRSPEILIIQLKRSQFGKKNQQPISFPVDLLNLKHYINSQSDKLSQKYSNYTLKSVVCHRGASDGGHYWALIKQYGQWYQIDDEKVTKLHYDDTKKQFQKQGSSQAYLLFYESMNR